jgi:hypothetical protein
MAGVTKTIRLPEEVIKAVEKKAEAEDRSFNKALLIMLKGWIKEKGAKA